MGGLSDLSFNGVAISAVLLGLAAAFWSKIKALTWRIVNLVVVRVTIDGNATSAVGAYLWRHGKRSRYGEKAYSGFDTFVRTVDRRIVVGFEMFSNDPAIFWFGYRPMLGSLSGQTMGNQFMGLKLTLSFFRWTFDADDFIKKAIDEFNDRRHGGTTTRFQVQRITGRPKDFGSSSKGREGRGRSESPSMHESDEPATAISPDNRLLGYTHDDIGPPIPEDPMSALAFPTKIDEAVADIKRWLDAAKWYKKRQIPWRFGIALVGAPGTGKTSLAKAIAQELDLPLFAFELATFDDRDMVEFWHKTQMLSPCMVVMEDIDTVFNGRTNITESENGLSFGCLLNCLSGVEGADGILTIVTTNRPETLDPALGVMDEEGRSSRPGRIDRVITLPGLDENCRQRIAERILDEWPDEVEKICQEGDGDSGAQFTERCAKLALTKYWDNPGRLPEPSLNGKHRAE